MNENEKTELLIRMDERLKNMQVVQESILDQCTKTNGRVTSLETWRTEKAGNWQATVVIAGLAGSIVSIAAALIIYFI